MDSLKLDGLTVALPPHAPGKMHEPKWKAVYVDEKATEEQKSSLLAIFGGQAGGHPAVLASFIGEMVGVKSAAIRFQNKGKRYSVSIPGAVDTQYQDIEGNGGARVTVANNPLSVAPGQTLRVARADPSRIPTSGGTGTSRGSSG